MTCAIDATVDDAPAAPAASLLTIKQITTPSPEAWIDAYIRCFNTNFGVPEHSQSGFGASFRGVLPNANALHFVAFSKGEAAGALSLFHNGPFSKNKVGGIYNVGTFPAFRGRGVATALLYHLVDVARRLGLASLILQTRHRGPAQPIYERVGFRVRFVRDWYLPDAPKGIWSE
jgi:ribosomal protein S18 acetylase RimI-like enzyme